jgi:catechol 2,3-dioxygenase-like lactoylglutathione lyase family enzyme
VIPRLPGINHVALPVDDLEQAVAFYTTLFEPTAWHRLDFRDPSGNRVQVVQYDQVQFTKPDRILDGMRLSPAKTDAALAELRAKGLAD